MVNVKKLISMVLCFLMVFQLGISSVINVSASDSKIPESIKILAIGNSFSTDSMQWLYDILTDIGVKDIMLGNIYKGGCALSTHFEYAYNSTAGYVYYECSNETKGKWVKKNEAATLLDGLKAHDWEYISMQQASANSGEPDTFEPALSGLIKFVNENKTNKDAKLMWNMTWAYQGDSKHAQFHKYGKKQDIMYYSILDAVKKKVLPHEEISFVIPVGTAIQNARTSFVGDTLTRDGHHLHNYIGRYIAGAMWVKSILSADLSSIKGVHSKPAEITPDMLEVVVESVENAYKSPYEVTQSKKKSTDDKTDYESNQNTAYVKITESGKYDKETDSFLFDNGILVYNGKPTVYLSDAALDLGDESCYYLNDTLYGPRSFLDILQGKVTYEKYSGPIVECNLSLTEDQGNFTAKIDIMNYLKDETLDGTIKFKNPEIASVVGDVEIKDIPSRQKYIKEISVPLYAKGTIGTDLSYDFVTEYGTYSYTGEKFFIFANSVKDISIDGKIQDNEWTNATKVILNKPSQIVNIKDWKGEDDLSVTAYIGYDDETFYFAAVCKDDKFKAEKTSAHWNGDSIQIAIWHDDSDDKFKPGSYPIPFTEFGVNFFEGKAAAYRSKVQTANIKTGDMTGLNLSIDAKDTETVYELSIKWKDLFGYDFSPKTNDSLGFGFLVNDNDGEGRRGWIEFAEGIGSGKDTNKLSTLVFNGEKEYFEDGIEYIPFRTALTSLGAKLIEWTDDTKTASATKNGVKFEAKIGESYVSYNGKEIISQGKNKIINDRTYIPLETLNDVFGYVNN